MKTSMKKKLYFIGVSNLGLMIILLGSIFYNSQLTNSKISKVHIHNASTTKKMDSIVSALLSNQKPNLSTRPESIVITQDTFYINYTRTNYGQRAATSIKFAVFTFIDLPDSKFLFTFPHQWQVSTATLQPGRSEQGFFSAKQSVSSHHLYKKHIIFVSNVIDPLTDQTVINVEAYSIGKGNESKIVSSDLSEVSWIKKSLEDFLENVDKNSPSYEIAQIVFDYDF